jgi:hypothetical protein
MAGLEIEPQWFAYVLIVLPIASVNLWFPAFARRFGAREDAWLGFTGGVALCYAVIYLLPKLGPMVDTARIQTPQAHPLIHQAAYLLLLAGILSYIIIDRLDQTVAATGQRTARYLEYSIHGLYAFLAAYVTVEIPRTNLAGHILTAAILVAHMMGMSNLLQHHRPQGYLKVRWLLVLLVVIGGTVALVTELPRAVINATTAYLCGIILLNVLAEELPIGHRHRLRWFLLGVGFFLAVTLWIN